jgi:hypothetical protein
MKTYAESAKEETGQAPACTGALLEVVKMSRQAVKKEDSEYRGCAQYVIQFRLVKPEAAKGMNVWDRIRIGIPSDKDAQLESTWAVTEGGPARIHRFLSRTGTPISRDDERWMADAVGRTVVAPIVVRGDFTNVGLYYRESDKDCPVIGLAGAGTGSAKTSKRVAALSSDDEESPPLPKRESRDESREDDVPF